MIGLPDPDFGRFAAALLQIVGSVHLVFSLFLLVHPRDGQCLAGTLRNLRVELFFPHGAAAHPLF